MKIGFVKMTPLDDDGAPISGVGSVVRDWIEALRRRGHDAEVFAFKDHLTTGENATAVYRKSLFGDRRLGATLRRWSEDSGVEILHFHTSLRQTFRALRRPLPRPAIASLHTFEAVCPLCTKRLPGGEACRFSPGPVCVRQGCRSVRRYCMHDLPARALRRRSWRFLSRVLVHNRALGEALGGMLSTTAVTRVPLGVDVARFAATRRPGDGRTVVYAGRFRREKGVHHLIAAFARVRRKIPAAKLLLIGAGEEEAPLLNLCDRLGVSGSVRFTGAAARREIPRRLSGASVAVLPSIWEENFGLAGLEAMAAGLPVVGSDMAGIREWLENGRNGYLVPPGDEIALASAVEKILRDNGRRREMGRAARITAEAFDIHAVTGALEKVYEQVIAEAGNEVGG